MKRTSRKLVGRLLALVAGSALAAVALADTTVTLANGNLSIEVDSTFPRVLSYTHRQDKAVFIGQASPVSQVELNGAVASCKASFLKTGPDGGDYSLTFPDQHLYVRLHVAVEVDSVDFRITHVEEGGPKFHTLRFPGDALLTIRSSQPEASLAAVKCYVADNDAKGVFQEQLGPLTSLADQESTANYLFLSEGPLAAGIGDNGIIDGERALFGISTERGERVAHAWFPVLHYREIDTELLATPFVKVIVTGDQNDDHLANWQDAALVYRNVMGRPLGHEFLGRTVADQIAMEYASGAQQPFLRILDAMKKVYLATDGLGQSVLIKGFTAEGHDQSNSDMYGHVNERAGGQQDLNYLIDQAHAINGRVGVHVNVSEVYPEARRYNPALLKKDARGNLIDGWNWLDVSKLLDKRKDVESGSLYAELDGLHKAMPALDFLYVDTYWENGWVAYKLASKVNSLGLPLYTEGGMALDPWTTWAHINTVDSQIMRFLWYSERDLWKDDPILRTAKRVGFLGWNNEGDFNAFVRNLFSRNLPARYLQSLTLLRETPDQADFDGEVKVIRSGDTIAVAKSGRRIMEWSTKETATRLFVPWDAKTESKIYVWDEVGTSQTWKLPPTWKGAEVYLYRLTDQGRVDETKLPVTDGSVTLTVAKETPYVLYPAPAGPEKTMDWGAGGLVKDPGFDSHGFSVWQPSGDAGQASVSDDSFGKARLVLGGTGAAVGVTQTLQGLRPGATYSASVWIQSHAGKKAWISVTPGTGAEVSNFTDTHYRHAYPLDPRYGSGYERVKVVFDQPTSSSTAKLDLKVDASGPTAYAEFSDVRVVEVGKSPEAAKHWFWEDFEHVDQGFGPFAICANDHSHLSEANPPYTTDVLEGKYSLKSRAVGRVFRTLPSSLRFKPNEKYRLHAETFADPGVNARLSVENEAGPIAQMGFNDGRSDLGGDFTTGPDGTTFLAIYKGSQRPGDMIVLDNLSIDDLGPGTAKPKAHKDADAEGKTVLWEESFSGPLAAEWNIQASKRPGTTVEAGETGLRIKAGANIGAFLERKIPAGSTVFEARIAADGDYGLTWGPGLAVLWPGGQAIRINLRNKETGFGVDSTAGPQVRGGFADADRYVVVRIRLDGDQVRAEARTDWGEWQEIASFSRDKFPGEPDRIRVGKMVGAGQPGDNSDPGPNGEVTIYQVRVMR